jgi:hypothetical protein
VLQEVAAAQVPRQALAHGDLISPREQPSEHVGRDDDLYLQIADCDVSEFSVGLLP